MWIFKKYKSIKKNFVKKNKGLIKPTDYNKVLSQKIYRTISIPIAKFLYKHTNISANQLTTMINIVSLLNAYLFYLGEYRYVLMGGILLILNQQVLDYTDGALARLSGTAGPLGTWYDHLSDWMSQMFVFLGMTWGVYNVTLDWRVWIFGFLAATSYMCARAMHSLIFMAFPKEANKMIEKEKAESKFIKNFYYDGAFVFLIIPLAAILNMVYPVLILLGIYGWIYCIIAGCVIARKIKHFQKC